MNASSNSASSIKSSDDEIDLGKVLKTAWRGKWIILFFTFFSCALGAYYTTSIAVPLYSTSARIVQETDKEPVVDFSAALGGGGFGGGGDQSAINTEVEVLRSRELLEKLVSTLELTRDPEFNVELRPEPFVSVEKFIDTARAYAGMSEISALVLTEQQTLDAVVDEVRDVITVSNLRQTYVFTITAVTENPDKSALIANTLAELYIDNQLDVKSEANARAMIWLTDRVSDLRLELEKDETTVKDFNAATDLINEESLAALNRQVKELRERLGEEQLAIAELDAHIQMLESADEDPNRMALLAQDRLLDRLLDDLINEPQSDRKAFDLRFERIVRQTGLERERLEAQIEALQASIADQEASIDQQSDDLLTLQQLQREAAASGLLYEFFLSRLKETSVQSGIQEADSRILSRAVVPLEPSAPRKVVVVALSLFIGLFIGMLIVLTRELRASTFRIADDLEQFTGLTVLGQIPRIPAGRRAKVLKYLHDKPTSSAAEAVRNLRTSVLLTDADEPPQVIMSTSSIPGEGKTTQSLALAQNLAGLGKKVLLVEGDIRKLVFAQYFNIADKTGLISVLEGRADIEDAAVFEPSLNADVLIGEKSKTNAADLFSGPEFVEFLNEMRTKYDYIIIDTPPVLAVPDARVIGRKVDAVIYTVKWDSTTRRQVTEGLKSLRSVGVKVSGLVLSQINLKGQRKYGYGDMSGSYGSYHDN